MSFVIVGLVAVLVVDADPEGVGVGIGVGDTVREFAGDGLETDGVGVADDIVGELSAVATPDGLSTEVGGGAHALMLNGAARRQAAVKTQLRGRDPRRPEVVQRSRVSSTPTA